MPHVMENEFNDWARWKDFFDFFFASRQLHDSRISKEMKSNF